MNTILQQRIEEAVKKTACPQCVFYDGGTCNNDDDCKLFDDFVGLMTFALQNQWISVEEECPIGTCVLLDKYGNMQLDRFDFRAWGYIQNKEITHWMPIPSLEGGEK